MTARKRAPRCEECGRAMTKSLADIGATTHPGCYEIPAPGEDTTTWPPGTGPPTD